MTLNALYVDFNSYFASVEQQLRPELRGKPIGVLAVLAETTCCIAASNEAKAFGVKTGTMVRDARKLCKDIIFVEARPPLYVELHHKLIAIVESCTHVEKVLSIDEMVCKLTGSQKVTENALALAAKIKRAVYKQYPYILCSIGIAPNTFLAKTASNMQKPNGCVVIEASDIPHKLYPLKLRSLNGIGRQMEERLQRYKIHTVEQLYALNRDQLRSAWGSIEGERYYDKLRGIEPYYVKNARSSLGHSHVLPPEQRNIAGAKAVLHRLLQKAAMRMRSYALLTTRISVKVKFRDHPSFYGESGISATDNTLSLIQSLETLWQRYPQHLTEPVAVGVSFSGLSNTNEAAYDLFAEKPAETETKLNKAMDMLNLKYGKNTVYFAGAHQALKSAPMRIAFNHIPDVVVEDDE
ncbi:DNA-directed DNA polymerase [Methylotenera sp. 1P/1]|uniref:DNA polymerase Y family protein n=1 Tax=Methylotenera sp. 1P/1 TaxID=1131551 RepID=UPI0003760951|nr:DNA-directed DNA polymerase [Methylotenera sp. 1P/1]